VEKMRNKKEVEKKLVKNTQRNKIGYIQKKFSGHFWAIGQGCLLVKIQDI